MLIPCSISDILSDIHSRSARMPRIRAFMDDVCLVRTSASQEDAFS